MAKIEDVLKIERERSQSTTWNEIHLFKVGEFYRAYEFSAWLTAVVSFNDHVRQQTKDRQPLKATRTVIAHTDDTFCFVGFPVKSINKFIPQREDFIAVDDKHLLIKIPHELFADVLQEVNYDSLVFAFNDWKNPAGEREKEKRKKHTRSQYCDTTTADNLANWFAFATNGIRTRHSYRRRKY